MPSANPFLSRAHEAWPAFWLSLAFPGAGQILARSATALVWFALAAAVVALFRTAASATSNSIVLCALDVGQVLALLALGLASALDARKRCLDGPRTDHPRHKCQVRCHAARGRSVQLSLSLPTSLDRETLWRRISDLPQSLRSTHSMSA